MQKPTAQERTPRWQIGKKRQKVVEQTQGIWTSTQSAARSYSGLLNGSGTSRKTSSRLRRARSRG